MRRVRGLHVFAAAKAEFWQIESREQVLSRSEQNRRDREMHLVDRPRTQIFADRGHAAAEADITVSRPRLLRAPAPRGCRR